MPDGFDASGPILPIRSAINGTEWSVGRTGPTREEHSQNQPRLTQWNLARLAETLLPLLAPSPDGAVAIATRVVESFGPLFAKRWRSMMCSKLGLAGEEALQAATRQGDLEPFLALLQALSRPYQDRPGIQPFQAPPRPEERVRQTFCGT